MGCRREIAKQIREQEADYLIAVKNNQPNLAQNRKYRCAIGSTLAGSQVSSCPSARTW
jgi:predicted transposase YbfD/YdcC